MHVKREGKGKRDRKGQERHELCCAGDAVHILGAFLVLNEPLSVSHGMVLHGPIPAPNPGIFVSCSGQSGLHRNVCGWQFPALQLVVATNGLLRAAYEIGGSLWGALCGFDEDTKS